MSEAALIKELERLCRKLLESQGIDETSGEFAVCKYYVTEAYSDGSQSWDIRTVGGSLMIYKEDTDNLLPIYENVSDGILAGIRYDFVDCCGLLNALRKHMILDALADI